MCNDIVTQFEKAIKITRETIVAFSEGQWRKGISDFEVPAKVAYHTVDALDAYFRENKEKKYQAGHRFGGKWSELSDDEQPSQRALVEYLDSIDERIHRHFENISDDILTEPYSEKRSMLGHFIYAIRHTMHHQGALTALAVYHKCDPDIWE